MKIIVDICQCRHTKVNVTFLWQYTVTWNGQIFICRCTNTVLKLLSIEIYPHFMWRATLGRTIVNISFGVLSNFWHQFFRVTQSTVHSVICYVGNTMFLHATAWYLPYILWVLIFHHYMSQVFHLSRSDFIMFSFI